MRLSDKYHCRCIDCTKNRINPLVINDDLWHLITSGEHERKGYLCLRCMTARVKQHRRQKPYISVDDLKPCGLTNSILLGVYFARNDLDEPLQEDFFEKY